VKWGELSKGSTVEPVLTRDEKSVAKKLLRVHGAAVDIKTYLSESNLAAAMITGSSAKPPPPPAAIRTPSSASAKGITRAHPDSQSPITWFVLKGVIVVDA
jgi:hypothetical protein